MKTNYITLLSVLIITLSVGCKKETDDFCDDPTDISCPNFDPCTQAVVADSDFKAVVSIPDRTDTLIDIEFDSAYGGNKTFFKANIREGIESYSWKIGDDPSSFTDSEVNLDFTAFAGNILITLETSVSDQGMCLTENQLTDVKSKSVQYVERDRRPSIYGIFKGTLIGENQTEYEVTVDNSNPPFRRLNGLPLPEDCNFNDQGIPLYYGYQQFVSNFVQEGPTPRCRNLTVIGRINLDNSNELRIDYVYDDDNGNRKEVVFVGQRQ